MTLEISHMKKAVEEALRGIRQGDGGPFGACIVTARGEVLAAAHNEVLKTNDATRHAEVICISEACRALGSWDLSGCTMYTTTECCPMCFAAAHWARISRVVFGTRIEDVARLGFHEMKLSNEAMNEFCEPGIELVNDFREECLAVLEAWENLAEKRLY
jgi:tRNA(Arg) A34 adenosine deaminase TadA